MFWYGWIVAVTICATVVGATETASQQYRETSRLPAN
jgi:hypothetical protein